LAAKSKDVEII